MTMLYTYFLVVQYVVGRHGYFVLVLSKFNFVKYYVKALTHLNLLAYINGLAYQHFVLLRKVIFNDLTPQTT